MEGPRVTTLEAMVDAGLMRLANYMDTHFATRRERVTYLSSRFPAAPADVVDAAVLFCHYAVNAAKAHSAGEQFDYPELP